MKPASKRLSANSYRMNSLVMLVLLIALATLLAWASTRYPLVIDWTRNGRHTLAEASIQVLERTDGPITVVSYAREQTDFRKAIRLFIEKFQRIKPDLSFRFQNPDTVPDEIREQGISINGELLIHYQGRTEHLREATESAFINALIRLSRSGETWLAFIEGHGERNPLGQANHDLGEWGKTLETRGYQIHPLNLSEVSAIPDNTSFVVLAGPRVPLLPGENDLLIQYLQKGGKLLWLVDPDEPAFTQPIADYLGIKIATGTVIDVAGKLVGITDPGITMITASLYGHHDAVKGFGFTTLFPRATALSSINNSNWTSTPLLTTGTHTWLETGPLDANSQFDAGADQQGPLTIGMALERPLDKSDPTGKQQRVIVIGDGDFVSNQFLGNAGNQDFGLRLVQWLAEENNLIDIPVRIATDTQLTLSSVTIGVIGIFFLIVLPLLLVLTCTTLWWRRKRS